MEVESAVIVALITGAFGVMVHIVNKVDKQIERYIGQKRFQHSAEVVLEEIRTAIEDIHTAQLCFFDGDRGEKKRELFYKGHQHLESLKEDVKSIDEKLK
jgi:hypothetical protein